MYHQIPVPYRKGAKRMMIEKNQRRFTFGEVYGILRDGMRTAPRLSRARSRHLIDKPFMERIMMAVTEVNGCAVCSYAHAKMALRAGMSETEIRNMSDGRFDDTPDEQMTAILFAQHYADNRALPDRDLWQKLIDRYGQTLAEGILGAIRIIMMGNAIGIPWGSLIGRFRGKTDSRSSLPYEIGILLGSVLLIPPAAIHAVVLTIIRGPLICTKRSNH